MVSKVHNIKSYNYSFDARSGGPDRLQLWGDNGLVAEIKFVADSASVPAPTLWANLSGANAFFKASHFLSIIDMLRNEKPVSLTVNDQPPGFVFINTGVEPVGEGEK
jgi:hypothetical protein